MLEPIALSLARWAHRLQWEDLPHRERDLAQSRLLDTVGLIMAGLASPKARPVLDMVRSQSGQGESGVFGAAEKLPATWAAFAHGIMAHCWDYDDTLLESVVHPGSVIIPVALAVGEATSATSEEIKTAIVIGYEAAARLGMAAGRRFHRKGFHASGIIGPLAGALTAAKLYGLDELGTARSMGIAASMSSGLLEFLADGSSSKWLHLGWSAHGAVIAAQLASGGFSGPLSAVEGEFGLYNVFLGRGEVDTSAICDALGRVWHGSDCLFKYYPCAQVIHPFLEAILTASPALPPADQVDAIECSIQPWCIPLVCEPREPRIRPQTELQAIASLPYMVATAIVRGEVGLASLTPAALTDPEVIAMAQKVRCRADPDLPQEVLGTMRLMTSDGPLPLSLQQPQPHHRGRLRDKFRRNVAQVYPAFPAEKLEAAIMSDQFLVSGLLQLLRTQPDCQ